jgi:hypothetical protein
MTELIVIRWLTLSVAVAVWAHSKGRSGWGYFLLGLLMSPLFSLAVVGSSTRNDQAIDERTRRVGRVKKCFLGAELVKIEALRCPHCHADLTPPASVTS